MTDKERKLNEIHNLIRDLYGEVCRVDIAVTYDDMHITTSNRINIRDYSMRRINGEWVEKQ